MPFHVEISNSLNHARLFNIDDRELRSTVLEPWVLGVSLELGEQEWDPKECRLTVLEGPKLAPPDLSFGQGWSNALRGADDVTRSMLEAAEASAPVHTAAMVEADSLDEALRRLRSGTALQSASWATAVERIDGRDPKVAAVILVVRRPQTDRR
jgi:hypothetical protein